MQPPGTTVPAETATPTERMPNLVGLVDPNWVAGNLSIGLDGDSAYNSRLSAASDTPNCTMNVKVNGSSNLNGDSTASETITAQSPAAGRVVSCGSTIDLTAS